MVLAAGHEIFITNLLPTINANDAFVSVSREEGFGVFWSLDLCKLRAAKVPDTDLDIFGLWSPGLASGLLDTYVVFASSRRSMSRSCRFHDVGERSS